MAYKIEQRLLTPSKWSRPQTRLKGVEGIVWHWVANPNSTASGNRNFFNNRTGSYGSAHYIIDLRGSLVIQALLDSEMGYHVGSHVYTQRALRELGSYPNNNTIGIECTHIDWNGNMTDDTYETLINLTVDLLKKHKLTVDDIWLHQEVVGWKDCHRYFVNNQFEYLKAKQEVAKRMNQVVKVPPVKVDPKTDTDMVKLNSDGYYTVQKGDTLWAISQAFDTTVTNLEKLNPNIKASELKIGSKVRVDSSKSISKPKPTPKPSTKKGDMKTTSIVTHLNSIEADSSFSNRKKLAKKYGINNYTGTASQNTALLNILRKGSTSTPSKPASKPKVKSVKQMADEVLASKVNGNEARAKFLGLTLKQYEPVRQEINKRFGTKATPSKPKRTVKQMADMIINDKKAPNGHQARQNWLGIDSATYQKVRAEVNRRLS